VGCFVKVIAVNWRFKGNTYWTHNTAYFDWILAHAKGRKRVLDVGCGDGLLVQRLAMVCGFAKGIEQHALCAYRAKKRTAEIPNADITHIDFQNFDAVSGSFDAVIFVASLHHMELGFGIQKAKGLLAAGGVLLIVGLAKPNGAGDWIIEILRMVPARIGSILHGEIRGGNIGAPTVKPKMSLADIRRTAEKDLPGAVIRRGLYYRYLLKWIKP